jgi:hypothetical protein
MKKEAAAEADAKWLPVVRDLKFSQAAVGRLAEPELAGQLLAKVEVDLDDHDAIVAAIEELVTKHPSLAASTTPPTPAFQQGPRGNGAVPQPTMNDVLLDAFGVKRHP